MKTPKEIGQEWDERIFGLDPQYCSYEELFKRFCYWRGLCLRAALKAQQREVTCQKSVSPLQIGCE